MSGQMSDQGFTELGVPIDSVGLGRAEAHGTELAPAAVRAAGLDRLGWADAGDLAVLDKDAFPATDYLQPGGLDWDELVDLVAPVVAADGLAGWSIACSNPEKDPAGADGRAIVTAIERLFAG